MSGSDHSVAMSVDATGLACPLPILRAKKALSQLSSGELLSVITTDRNAVRDFQAFCRQSGNTLVEQVQNESVCTHYIARR
ncbi:MAG: sulfurtransferase TusA family protein [Burkholderiaceae bacterium]